MANIGQGLFDFSRTDFTKVIRRCVYPTVDPGNPLLTQAGKTILITGGGVNLGFAIASAFVVASAETIIITGRQEEVLDQAKAKLESQVQAINGKTKILVMKCDLTDRAQIDALWTTLNRDLGLTVHVFISCAARPPAPKSLLDSGADEIWTQMETNVMGPLYMAERLCAQEDKAQKFIVNLSVASLHYYIHPAAAAHPGGTLTKTSNTTLFQLLAMGTSLERLQVLSYHPGLLWNEYFESKGLSQDDFDSRELAAAIAVWASTKEAAFVNGRFIWASWDVDELSSDKMRQELDKDPYFLRVGVPPLRGGSGH